MVKKDRKRGIGRLLYYSLSALWLGLVATTGFFFPYVIDSVPYFNISRLEIEGLRTIPPSLVSQAVSKVVKNNWLFLYTNKMDFVRELRQATGDAVADVEISPRFSSTGVEIRLRVVEREPLIAVVSDDKVVLFDRSGYAFYNSYYELSGPMFYTTDLSLVKENFQTVSKLVSAVNNSGFTAKAYYITDVATLVYTMDDIKIVLPPVFAIKESMLHKIKRTYNMSVQGVREIEFVSDSVVVIKGKEDR